MCVTQAMSQDPVFSQYYSSSLYLNPALAGIEKQTTLGANYRSQWNKLVLPFNTFQVSFVQPVFQRGARKKHIGGAGISVMNDTAGPSKEFSSQSVSVSAAYNLYFGSSQAHTVSFAVQGGISQQRISFDNLRWTSQYGADNGFDPTMPGESAFANTNIFKPLLGLGAMWSYNASQAGPTWYQGLAATNILRSQSHFAGMLGDSSPAFKAHGGVNLPLDNAFELSPNYLVQRQGSNQQINVGMYAAYSLASTALGDIKFTLGTWYRLGDSFILSGGVATKKVSVAFSFDNNVSSMGRSFGNASAHEVSMSYRMAGKSNFKRISSPLI
jgi:type IX secretion system PorP/SprF family membrane protein